MADDLTFPRKGKIADQTRDLNLDDRFLIYAAIGCERADRQFPKSAPVLVPSRPGKKARDGISFDGIPRVGFSAGNLPVAFEFREFLARVSASPNR